MKRYRALALLILLVPLLSYAAVTVTVNGTNHQIPTTNERGWGTAVTTWIQAISANTLQPTGGTFTLTSELDLGANFGLKSVSLKSRALNPATSGFLRLGNADTIGWRNATNTGNLLLGVDANGVLTFNGNPLASPTALTPLRALVTDAAGVLSASSVTSTELGYLSGLAGLPATATALSAHTGASNGAHAASAISVAPSGNLASTNTQAALTELQTDVDGKANAADLTSHTANTSNPHSVTKAQVGLGNVDNTSDATKNSAAATLSNKTLATPTITGNMVFQEQGSTPSAPAVGYKRVYPRTDGKLYTLDSAGNEKEIGAGASGGGSTNTLTNSSFEDTTTPTSGWTVTNGTCASDGLDYVDDGGTRSLSCTLSSVNGKVIGQSVTTKTGGLNFENTLWVKTSLAGGKVCAAVNGVDVQCLDVPSTNTWTKFTPTSVTSAAQSVETYFKTTSSVSGTVKFDAGYQGLNRNLGTVEQAQIVGSLYWPATAGCVHSSTATVNYTTPAADNDCPAPVVTGNAVAPATKIPAGTFTNLGKGEYEITMEKWAGYPSQPASADTACNFRLTDGTTTYASGTSVRMSSWTTAQGLHSLRGTFTVTQPLNQQSISLQLFNSGVSATCSIDNQQAALGGMTMTLKKFPSSSEQVLRPENSNWEIEALIVGSNYPLGLSSQTSWANLGQNDWVLYPRANSAPVGIACNSSTTQPVGNATCDSIGAVEQGGITFNLPTAGKVQACVELPWYVAGSTNSTTASWWKIFETDAQGVTEPQSSLQASNVGCDFGTSGYRCIQQVNHCTTLTFATPGQKYLRAKFQSGMVNPPAEHIALFDNSKNRGMKWTVRPVTQNMPAVSLSGSVTSNASGQERIERALILGSATTPTVSSQSGNWISSVSRTATGEYSLNLAPSVFSAAPTCTITPSYTSGLANQVVGCRTGGANPTLVTTLCNYSDEVGSTGAGGSMVQAFDFSFNIICMGPR